MKKEIPIQIPLTPSFIRVGLGDIMMLPLSDFTEEELKEIGARWTEELIKKSKIK